MAILDIFKDANDLTEDALVVRLEQEPIDETEKAALILAVRGDHRAMNDWMFSLPADYSREVHWIAPVLWEGTKKFAWMVGHQSPLTPKIRELFALSEKGCATDPLLEQKQIPEPLFFIRPTEVTKFDGWEWRKDTDKNEFAIFQTGFNTDVDDWKDFDQRMALNVQYLVDFRLVALERMETILGPHPLIEEVRNNVEFYALLHTEGHNRGHFTGPWPLDPTKISLEAEILEEGKSCLAAIAIAEHMPLTNLQRDALALSIYATRFFGYGFNGYVEPKKRREETREIMVGMILEQAMRGIPIELVRPTLLALLAEIVAGEHTVGRDVKKLSAFGLDWTRRIFPNKTYPEAVREVYSSLIVG
jgi:hypothetical protein